MASAAPPASPGDGRPTAAVPRPRMPAARDVHPSRVVVKTRFHLSYAVPDDEPEAPVQHHKRSRKKARAGLRRVSGVKTHTQSSDPEKGWRAGHRVRRANGSLQHEAFQASCL